MENFLKGPLTATIEAIGGVIGKFVLSPEDKLKAQQELLKIETDFRMKAMEVDLEYAKAGASVINTEAGSKNVLASSWRPVLMLTFTFIVLYNYVLSPLFHVPSVPIPPDMWDMLKLGTTGYIVGRSAEKTLPQIAGILKK